MNSFTMSFAVHTLIPVQQNEQLEDYNKKNATKVHLPPPPFFSFIVLILYNSIDTKGL
jgi:hypothetical protein